MIYEVQGTPAAITFNPKTVEEEVIQNVRTIITTARGSVPFGRDIGVDPEGLDLPIHIAQAKITARIFDAIRKDEPRADVVSISFQSDEINGRLIPTVTIEIKDGE